MFDISEIKKVDITNNAGDVNKLLDENWVLLAVNQYNDDGRAGTEFVIGKK